MNANQAEPQKHRLAALQRKKQERADIELLVEFSRTGKTEAILRLLANGVSIESQAKNGRTALHAASEAGQIEAVKLLLKNGANLEARIPGPENFYRHADCTPLMLAAWKGHDEVVSCLLTAGADPRATYGTGRNALACAIHGGHLPIIKRFVKLGIKVPPFALHRPVACGNIEVIKYLIKVGADLSFRTKLMDKPLLVTAAMNGGGHPTRVIDLLLKAGVDINSKEGEQTALMRAIHVDATASALHLMKRGADIHHCDRGGRNALMYAVDARSLQVAEALLKAGAKVDLIDVRGDTVFTLAKRNKDRAMLSLLDQYAKKPASRNTRRTPSGK